MLNPPTEKVQGEMVKFDEGESTREWSAGKKWYVNPSLPQPVELMRQVYHHGYIWSLFDRRSRICNAYGRSTRNSNWPQYIQRIDLLVHHLICRWIRSWSSSICPSYVSFSTVSHSNANPVVSEIVGRKPIYCISLFFYFIFTLPSALAPNIGTMLAGRLVSVPFYLMPRYSRS